MNRIPVGILGGSGYAGRELLALIDRHPALELAFATANDQRGQLVRAGGGDVTFVAPEDAVLGEAALVFSALPHGASADWVARARAAGARVVDLSSDLRPGQRSALGARRSAKEAEAPGGEVAVPYGLTELTRDQVRAAHMVANPGCYATAVLVALAPLAQQGLLAPGATVSVSAASGVSGAGNSPKRELLFAEVASDFRAYAAGNVHRHLLEMNATLVAWGADVDLVFTPHLLPVARGILATITVPLARDLDGDVMAPWREAYAGEPFVELADDSPALRDVVHRNVVRVNAVRLAGVRRPTLLVQSAIDNLVKGAAGQALQNANLMLGLDETLGLPA